MDSSKIAYGHIRHLLLEGECLPLVPMPVRIIEEKLRLSMIPVREALIQLTHDGLLHHVPGRGFYPLYPDQEELIGIYDFVHNLALDAVTYIVGDDSRLSAYRFEYNTTYGKINKDRSSLSALQYSDLILGLISKHYRVPHSSYLLNAIDRATLYLKFDYEINGGGGENRKILFESASRLLAAGNREKIIALLKTYMEMRKNNVPKVMSQIKVRGR